MPAASCQPATACCHIAAPAALRRERERERGTLHLPHATRGRPFVYMKVHLAGICFGCCCGGMLQMKSSIRERRLQRQRHYVYAAYAATAHNADRVCCGLSGSVYNGIRLSADKATPHPEPLHHQPATATPCPMRGQVSCN